MAHWGANPGALLAAGFHSLAGRDRLKEDLYFLWQNDPNDEVIAAEGWRWSLNLLLLMEHGQTA